MDIDKERKGKIANIIPFPRDLHGLMLTEEPETPRSALVYLSAL